ncbi:MAG TPA: hypothetical protein VGF24_12015 [Vicinamibacterales bacterium]|jgi:hypothetical protein
MKPFTRIVLTAIALLWSVSFVAAQTPTAVVNKLEVQKLVAAGTPEANATLARHFTALADEYAADAARHKDMAAAYGANPNRSVVTNIAPHCARLADLATEEATAAREMARYHEQLAAGANATTPKEAAAFHAGKGAPEPTKADVHQLAMMARTPADHHALEEYFTTLAKKNTADAESHVAMARAYRAAVRKGGGDPAAHCDRLVKLARDAAKEATGAAALHRQLANVG